MKQDKVYPAIWYGVQRYRNTIDEKEFIHETSKRLYFKTKWGARYYEKTPKRYYQGDEWFPTREQAEKRLAELKADEVRRNERLAKDSAAPEMFAALESVIDSSKILKLCEGTSSTARIEWSKALASAVLAVKQVQIGTGVSIWLDSDEEKEGDTYE